jgi:hypothetical protein
MCAKKGGQPLIYTTQKYWLKEKSVKKFLLAVKISAKIVVKIEQKYLLKYAG